MTTSDGDTPITQVEVAPSPSVIKRKREDFETLNLQFPTSGMIEYREMCLLMKELVAQLLKVVKENRETHLPSELEMLKELHKRLCDILLENLKMVANMRKMHEEGKLLPFLLGGEPLPKQKRLDESDEDIEGLACSGDEPK